MSESLTINTLNQGHFTHTHTYTRTPYNHTQRLGWDQVGGGGGKTERASDKKGESSIQGPRGQVNRAEFLPWAYVQGGGR